MTSYYGDKADALSELFGCEVVVSEHSVDVGDRSYPVVDDVIVVLDPARMPAAVRARLPRSEQDPALASDAPFASDIQSSFGAEWTGHPKILPEHAEEFAQYFDVVDLDDLNDARVLDLGCGIGRWATFLADRCRTVVLVDFSEAVFVARENMRSSSNAIFVMGDLLDLPFADKSFDFAYTLGVLHHLPVDALDALRDIRRLAPRHLVYLYYALDNRPAYFRAMLAMATAARRRLAQIRSARVRNLVTWAITIAVYEPLVLTGKAVARLGGRWQVPLADAYAGWSVERIRQDVYDRFFTSIEQRFTRQQIEGLSDSFSRVVVSDGLPFWHFLCEW